MSPRGLHEREAHYQALLAWFRAEHPEEYAKMEAEAERRDAQWIPMLDAMADQIDSMIIDMAIKAYGRCEQGESLK